MKPLVIIRAQRLANAMSPEAILAWKKLWVMPTPNLVNLRTSAELMTEAELQEHFEHWYDVVQEDAKERRLEEQHKARGDRYVPKSKPKEVRNHVLELYVFIREILRRFKERRLHLEQGLISKNHPLRAYRPADSEGSDT